MNLHTQTHLTSENSPTCTFTSKFLYCSDFCCSVTNDCSRKAKAALPASVEPLTLSVPSDYIARTTDPTKLRDVEFYAMINLSNYSLSYSGLRVLSMDLRFTPNPPHVNRLILRKSLRRFDRNLRLREFLRIPILQSIPTPLNFAKILLGRRHLTVIKLWICFFPSSILN